MVTKAKATIEDLYHLPENGKAEIVNGELVRMCPTGIKPGRAGGRIYASLLDHEDRNGGGFAVPDNVGFIVNLPNRSSFSPDAAWIAGAADSDSMKFVQGAPAFGVEVRSEHDYSPKAEREILEKVADYFAAGTLVVWDVDLLGENVIRAYRAGSPETPLVFRRGETAHAEPAVPGWTFPVDRLFPKS